MAPIALAVIAFTMTAFQLVFLIDSGRRTEFSAKAIATFLLQQPEAQGAQPRVITDKPIWLNMTSGLPTLALPAQSPEVVLKLAHDQGATLILVAEQRGGYPASFRSGALASCFVERPRPDYVPVVTTLFAIAEACR